jgi:hypothetical protein
MRTTSNAAKIVRVRSIAPTTPPERIALIAKAARGFIYYVSREGVTGGARFSCASVRRETRTHSPAHGFASRVLVFGDFESRAGCYGCSCGRRPSWSEARLSDLIGKIGDRDDLADRVGKSRCADCVSNRQNAQRPLTVVPSESRGIPMRELIR